MKVEIRSKKVVPIAIGIRIQKVEFRIKDTDWNAVKCHVERHVLSLSAQIDELILRFEELI